MSRQEERYLSERYKLVVKANTLIQKSRFSLSLQQQKIVLYLISKINYGDSDFQEYELDIKDFCLVCGIDYRNGKNYIDLKEQIKEIRDKSVWVTLPNGEETTVTWIEKPYISRNSGKIRIRLDRDMKPFLLMLKDHFTQYELVYTLAMKSRYSIRLYELVKSYHYKKLEEYTRTFTVEELQKLLGAENYKFGNFNQRVLKPATEEINKYTDTTISYELIKHGNKVVEIEFLIKTKEVLDRLKTRNLIEDELGNGQLTIWDRMIGEETDE